jgi:hypothetical protein
MAWQAILGIGSAILGGIGSQAAADAQNEAIERQYKYDTQAWRMGKQRIRADYRHDRKQWKMNIRNDETLAAYKDATNQQDWEYSKKIVDHEYASQMRQFNKSEQVYSMQLDFNNDAAKAAREAENRKLQDAATEMSFKNQDLVFQALEAEGGALAKGQGGRSTGKSVQSVQASLGRNQAVLAESMLSARKDTTAAMRKIATDKFGADIAAHAARMLKPERAPYAPQPIRTPRTKFLAPRKPKKFDFGPKPVKGAAASAAAGWANAGASALGSIAAAIPTK